MYFDFEDYRPDITPVGRAISWREGILISIIARMAMVILLLLAPNLFPFDEQAARARAAAIEQQLARQREQTRFVFVQPRVDLKALSSRSAVTRPSRSTGGALERLKKLQSSRSRAATRELVEERGREARGRGRPPILHRPAGARSARTAPAYTTDARSCRRHRRLASLRRARKQRARVRRVAR